MHHLGKNQINQMKKEKEKDVLNLEQNLAEPNTNEYSLKHKELENVRKKLSRST